jgi:hypothetical protein
MNPAGGAATPAAHDVGPVLPGCPLAARAAARRPVRAAARSASPGAEGSAQPMSLKFVCKE